MDWTGFGIDNAKNIISFLISALVSQIWKSGLTACLVSLDVEYPSACVVFYWTPYLMNIEILIQGLIVVELFEFQIRVHFQLSF